MDKPENNHNVGRVQRGRVVKVTKAKSKLLKTQKQNRKSGKLLPTRLTRTTRNQSKQIQARSSAVNHNSFFENLSDMEADATNGNIENEIPGSVDRMNSTNKTIPIEIIDIGNTSSNTSGVIISDSRSASIVSISSDTSFAMSSYTDYERKLMGYMKELLVRMGSLEKQVAKLDVRIVNNSKIQSSDRQDTFVNVPTKLDINDLNELHKRCLPVNTLSNLNSFEQKLKCEEFTKSVVSEITISLNHEIKHFILSFYISNIIS